MLRSSQGAQKLEHEYDDNVEYEYEYEYVYEHELPQESNSVDDEHVRDLDGTLARRLRLILALLAAGILLFDETGRRTAVALADPGGVANAGGPGSSARTARAASPRAPRSGSRFRDASAEFGTAVAWADVDGSTFQDALISAADAPNATSGFANAGEAFVYFGPNP